MRVTTVVGARPQFIKAAAVSRAFREAQVIEESIVHTGQHFDQGMSDVFFEQLGIPAPGHYLGVSGGGHGAMTGAMLQALEPLLQEQRPDWVLVYGDTNSTLAGALGAAKLHIPVAHVEAGLRSFDKRMPEEINRILTDNVSDLLLCPTQAAVNNLVAEGFERSPARVVNVGDVMQDSAIFFSGRAVQPRAFPEALLPAASMAAVQAENESCNRSADTPEATAGFILATLHRAENTDNPQRLSAIVTALNEVHKRVAPVVLPLHPRTRAALDDAELSFDFMAIDPVGYLEMVWLLDHCQLVLTDSGGVQKEAFFFGKPCVTMRNQTEWVELVDIGANELAGAETEHIIDAAQRHYGRRVVDNDELYGGGRAAERIVQELSGERATI